MFDGVVEPPHIEFSFGNNVICRIYHEERITRKLNATICAFASKDDTRSRGERFGCPSDWPVAAEHAELAAPGIVIAKRLTVFERDFLALSAFPPFAQAAPPFSLGIGMTSFLSVFLPSKNHNTAICLFSPSVTKLTNAPNRY